MDNGREGTSVDPPLLDGIICTNVSPDDKKLLINLYQSHPQFLSIFQSIVGFVEMFRKDPWAYTELYKYLFQMFTNKSLQACDNKSRADLSIFATIVGFAESGVDLLRQIMQDKGMYYVTEFTLPHKTEEMACLWLVRNIFMLFSISGMEFRLRLAQTGVLQDLLEDLKHMKHLVPECLENGEAYFSSMFTIHNCCRNPEVVPVMRESKATTHIEPFLTKRSRMVRAAALSTLGLLVDDSELDLLRLDADLLEHYLEYGDKALATEAHSFNGWSLTEVVFGLSCFARNQFNKSFIIANGGLKLLLDVLESGTEEEMEPAMMTVQQLIELAENIPVFQRTKRAKEVLRKVSGTTNQALHDAATRLLSQLDIAEPKPGTVLDEMSVSTKMDELCLSILLKEQTNMPIILGCSKVKFVLSQLDVITAKGRNGLNNIKGRNYVDTINATPTQLLHALAELVETSNGKKEIVSAGGLDTLSAYLRDGTQEDKLQTAKILLELASCAECSCHVQGHPVLHGLLQDFVRSEHAVLSQVAGNVIRALGHHASPRADNSA